MDISEVAKEWEKHEDLLGITHKETKPKMLTQRWTSSSVSSLFFIYLRSSASSLFLFSFCFFRFFLKLIVVSGLHLDSCPTSGLDRLQPQLVCCPELNKPCAAGEEEYHVVTGWRGCVLLLQQACLSDGEEDAGEQGLSPALLQVPKLQKLHAPRLSGPLA